MATSIRNAGNVVLPIIDTSTANDSTVTEEVEQSGSFLRPLEIFEQGAIALGHANILPDKDGAVRRLPIVIRNGNDYELALALAAVAKYLQRPGVIGSPIEDNVLPFAGRLIPIDDNNGMIINYTGTSQWGGATTNFQTVSFVDTLRGEISPNVFQDKIVVIGATAGGLGDTYWTPMGRMMNGTEIHASAINTILAGNFVKSAPFAVTIASIIILALLCGVAVLRLRVLWAVLSAIFLCIVYFLIAFALFDKGFMMNMLYPPLAIIGTFVGVSVYNLASERAEKNKITKTFGRYISPSIVDKILAALEEGELKLGGEQREVTAAFADVRGFASMTESMQTEDLVRVLNTYLSVVIKAVLKHDGMINKFGGDSIMAIWNVPTVCEGHALLATLAAMDAQRAIRELQKREIALPKMDFGIGINTGKAVAGNIGSEDRLEYSVIGDAVNVAARLTSVVPGGKVWISVNTFELVKDYITAKPLKPLVVKGKRKPIIAYEVVDVRPELVDGQDKNAMQ